MSEEMKTRVQQQFGKNAEKYVTSVRHAKGEDLTLLVSAAQATKEMTVLDIATGGGHVANALAPLVKQVTALDLTQEMLNSAKVFIEGNGHGNVEFVKGDAEQLPFEDASFDIVTCRIAAHHFPNVPAFLREAYRVLKPGGKLQLIDNVSPEDGRLGEFYNEVERLRDRSHVRALSKSEWIGQLEQTHFQLDALICFQKPFEFQSWCQRMGLTPEEQGEVKAEFIKAEPATWEFFRITADAGEIVSFVGQSAYFQASKSL
ncbi:methyltransferase domain-containing protein [Paenibacillus sp. NPDC058177]|uniref:methyltransferase domain-containing protein n=1 Tax=Paenibacillus sp. NPDC058177 TaxID=3346369 RepID=UPI0036DDB5DC